ncbi:MAG: YhjD/YihY/BrkB family envelope integrity protein, partial [Pirellulales bacterium]
MARWSADDCGMASAAMSYYFACALFPLCLVLISMLGTALSLSSQAADARQQLLDLASRQASPWLAEQLTSVLDSAARNAPQGGRWGMFFLVVAAIGIFHQLDTFLDRLWRGAAPQASGVWNAIRRAATSRLTAFL